MDCLRSDTRFLGSDRPRARNRAEADALRLAQRAVPARRGFTTGGDTSRPSRHAALFNLRN